MCPENSEIKKTSNVKWRCLLSSTWTIFSYGFWIWYLQIATWKSDPGLTLNEICTNYIWKSLPFSSSPTDWWRSRPSPRAPLSPRSCQTSMACWSAPTCHWATPSGESARLWTEQFIFSQLTYEPKKHCQHLVSTSLTVYAFQRDSTSSFAWRTLGNIESNLDKGRKVMVVTDIVKVVLASLHCAAQLYCSVQNIYFYFMEKLHKAAPFVTMI